MILEAEKLTFSYGKKPVLKAISGRLAPGKVVFLMGGNGSGKSTLLKLLAGVLTPDAGAVKLDGQNLSALPRRSVAAHCGVVRQLAMPTFDYTVREFVLFGRNAKLGAWRGASAADLAAVERALGKVALENYADRIANTLSGGEFQRLALASALALEGEFLLLDEPLSAQDPAFAQRLMRKIQAESAVRGVLVISHDLALAQEFADEVWLLADGELVAIGTPQQVLIPENLDRVFNCRVEVKRAGIRYEFRD